MESSATPLRDALILSPRVFNDPRGYFFESYRASALADLGIHDVFVQDNHSYSEQKGVLRGMHFQTGEFEQSKFMRVISGSIYDVIVDIRPDSPTFKQWFGEVLSTDNRKMMYVPRGFAHGFVVLEDHTTVLYKTDNYYSKEHESGFRWDDPEISIEWPVEASEILLSDKDQQLGDFSSLGLTR